MWGRMDKGGAPRNDWNRMKILRGWKVEKQEQQIQKEKEINLGQTQYDSLLVLEKWQNSVIIIILKIIRLSTDAHLSNTNSSN